MYEAVVLLGALAVVGYIIFSWFNKAHVAQQDAQIIDLTKKIDEAKGKVLSAKKEADASLEKYEDAKKAYDRSNDPNKSDS